MNSKKKLIDLIKTTLANCSAEKLTFKSLNMENGVLTIGKNKYNLDKCQNITLFGSGKAAGKMAVAVEKKLGKYIKSGHIISNNLIQLNKIEFCLSSHPIPDLSTFQATTILLNKMHQLSENDFFIYLLSGGTSSMVEQPVYPFTMNEISILNHELINSGMNIEEINTIRNCFSSVKGGRLAEEVKGEGVVLVLSDVLGDALESIGSAPLYGKNIQYDKALKLIKKYHLNLNDKFLHFLSNKKTIIKSKNKFPHIIIGNNKSLLDSCKEIIEVRKNPVFVYENFLFGEAKEKGKEIADFLIEKSKTTTETSYFIFGGETSVTVKGTGKGGRNQELILSALNTLKDNPKISLLSIGSDGIDGFTDVAGAFIDKSIYKKSQKLNLIINKYLDNNDSYNFFKKTNSHIKTGPTGNNLLDICVAEIKR